MSEVMARVDGRGNAAIRAASATVSSRTVPGSHTCRASPRSTSSSALTQSDVRRTRAARCQPITAGKRKLLAASGGTPSSEKGTRRRAPRSTSTRSQCASMVKPSPTATPLTAARSGTDMSPRHSSRPWKPRSEPSTLRSRRDRRHFGQVRAGGERPVLPGHDDGADPVVRVGGAQRGRELEVHGRVERVAHLGPVEGQDADTRRGVLGLDAAHADV